MSMRPGDDVNGAVIEQAVAWLSHLWSGEASDASRAEWRRWRDADPTHERAWQQIEAMDARWARGGRSLTADSALTALSAPAASRRRALKTLSLLLLAGSSGYVAQRELPWPAWVADTRTGTGARRSLTLADGSNVTLNTDSAIDIAFSDARRLIELVRGEIAVVTATDKARPPRPLVVHSAAGSVQTDDAHFLLHQRDSDAVVSVLQGSALLQPADPRSAPLRLEAGSSVAFSQRAIGTPQPLGNRAAWLDGVLIASNTMLAEFINDLSRYYSGHISCDPAIADLRLSGTFPLSEVRRIPVALTQVLPVRVQTFGPWLTRIVPAADGSAPKIS